MKISGHLIRLLKVFYSYTGKDISPVYHPLKLWVETTSRCNLRCSSCLNRKLPREQKKDMDIDLYKNIIDQAAGNIYDINLFHRGESLLHPDIAYMVSYASRKGLKTRIHTNATLLDGKLGKNLITAGLDSISFSIDTLDPDIYRQRRKGADLGEILENIRKFLETRKKMGRKKPSAAFQLMADSSTDRKALSIYRSNILKEFRDFSPYRVIIRTAHNWGGLLDKKTRASKPVPRIHACTFPWYSLTIFPDGKAYPCPQDFMGAMPAGDLKRETLQDIFTGKSMTGMRKMFVSGKINKKLPCFSCDRIIRKTILGIPYEYAGMFFRDHTRFRI